MVSIGVDCKRILRYDELKCFPSFIFISAFEGTENG